MKRVSFKADTPECEMALYIDDSHKNALYHIFFGWRRTFKVDNIEIMDFILTNKEINLIKKFAKKG